MAFYKVQWKHSAEKDLSKIDLKDIPRIIEAVDSLANNPFPPQNRKLQAVERFYRIRVGDYRVIYQVDTKSKTVTIYYVRHRRDAYRKL
ncbi:MAG: type II toxin-antitoxin system RelE/ParE family toxin [Acidobacteriota bacterium]